MTYNEQRAQSPKIKNLDSSGIRSRLHEIGEMQQYAEITGLSGYNPMAVLEYRSPNLQNRPRPAAPAVSSANLSRAALNVEPEPPGQAPQQEKPAATDGQRDLLARIAALQSENHELREQVLGLTQVNMQMQENYSKLLRERLRRDAGGY